MHGAMVRVASTSTFSTGLVLLSRLLIVFWIWCPESYSVVTDGRHSFGLTTFNTDGKLEQVERALIASSLGTPIIGVIKGDSIILASPQILPSPFMNDDGTSRFSVVSPQIVVCHSGISSDGRVLVESAQRLAIEHAYTFDEPIPIGLFLEEVSLLFQEYTMKPGARPFGCTLLVGFLPPLSWSVRNQIEQKPRLFQIDCSGTVVEHDTIAIINEKILREKIRPKLIDLTKYDEVDGNYKIEKDRDSVSQILLEAFERELLDKESSGDIETVFRLPVRIISASFCQKEGFKVERRQRRVASSGLEPKIIK